MDQQKTRASIFIGALGLASVGLTGAAAHAATLTYTGQSRTVVARAAGVTDQSASAPGFTDFNGSVTATGTPGNNGFASQQSQLSASGVSMSGQLSGNRTQAGQNGAGQSTLDVTFTLDAASGYYFTINPYNSGTVSPDSHYTVSLTNTSTNATVFSRNTANNGYGATTALGTLSAGAYELNVYILNDTFNGISSVNGSYAATLAVPEPASIGLAVFGLGLPLMRRRRA